MYQYKNIISGNFYDGSQNKLVHCCSCLQYLLCYVRAK